MSINVVSLAVGQRTQLGNAETEKSSDSFVVFCTGLRLFHSGAGEECEGLWLQHQRREGVQDGLVCAPSGWGRPCYSQRQDEGKSSMYVYLPQCMCIPGALMFQRLECSLNEFGHYNLFLGSIWFFSCLIFFVYIYICLFIYIGRWSDHWDKWREHTGHESRPGHWAHQGGRPASASAA